MKRGSRHDVEHRATNHATRVVRYVIPTAITVAGVVVLVVGGWREDAARSYFDEHGRWPDEVPDRRSI
jgi:hypothetical protein